MSLSKRRPIRKSVVTLDDHKLQELIVALKFNTRLEQATLAAALAEKRRRARASKQAKAAR